jgi:hypothetical protein
MVVLPHDRGRFFYTIVTGMRYKDMWFCKESDARLPQRERGWIRQLKTLTYGFTKFTQK